MKNYLLILKSHTDAPDYEDEFMAKSKEEAVDYFYNKLKKYEWEKEDIAENVGEIWRKLRK